MAPTLAGCGAAGLLRAAYEQTAARLVGRDRLRARELLLIPAKDFLIFATWVHGWLHNTIEWRSASGA